MFIKSYETNVMIHKINASLGKQLLLIKLVSNPTMPKSVINDIVDE